VEVVLTAVAAETLMEVAAEVLTMATVEEGLVDDKDTCAEWFR